jgi:exoribonuclease II
VDNLIAGAECQVQEGWNWHSGTEKALSEGVADVVNSVHGVGGGVEASFRADDVDAFSILKGFADKRHVLQTINRELLFRN